MPDLIDQFGLSHPRPDAGELSLRTSADDVRDRASLGSILTNLTPRGLLNIFAEADNGLIGKQIELAGDIEERDGHITGLMERRRMAVTGLETMIVPGDESEASQKVAEECREWWEALDGEELIDRLMDATLAQWSVLRAIWDTSGSRWTPIGFEEVDARRMYWPQIGGPEQPLAAPLLMRNWSLSDGEPIVPGKFICRGYRVQRGRPGKKALVRAVAFAWLVKRFALIDFATLSEKFGQPMLIVKHAPGATPEEITKLLTKLVATLADRVAAVPQGSDVETSAGTAHTTSPVQEALMRACDEICSKAIVGSTTVTDAAQNNESVSSPTHKQGADQYRDSDARSCARVVTRDLIRPWFEWQRTSFEAEARCPRLVFNLAPRVDPAARSTVYESAARMGLRVKSDQVYRELGMEKPDDVEEVIELKASTPDFGLRNADFGLQQGRGMRGEGRGADGEGAQEGSTNKDQKPGTED